MPRELSEEILSALRTTRTDTGPLSMARLSRMLGVSAKLITSCATEMVGRGIAEPAMVTSQGVQRIHGLMPQTVAKKVVAPTAAPEPEAQTVAI